MGTTVIAWDKNIYSDRLRDEAGGETCVVTSKDDLDVELGGEGEWNNVRLVVLLELDWKGQRSRFQGFDLVKELLLDDFDRPIVLCSFLSKEQFYSAQGIGRFLAQMPFPFVQLPVTPSALEEKARNAEAFSPMLRAFVRENYLVQEPFGRIAHDLRVAMSKDEVDMRRAAQRLLDDLAALNVTLPVRLAEQRRAVDQALKQDGESRVARTAIEELASRLEQHATSRVSEARERRASPKASYAVLLVEDDEVQRKRYRRGLEPYFEVHTAVSAEEALAELRVSQRKYLAVVADWVLLEEDGITWQPMQGFDLLVEAWKESAPICLVALTSLNREAVASVLRSAPLEIDWFYKDEVGDDTRWPFHAFAGHIRKRVRALLPDLMNMPDSTWWTEKGLSDLFWELKYESGRWEQVRRDVEETAAQIVEEFIKKIAAAPINKGDYKLKAPGRETKPTMDHLEMILPQRLAVIALHFEHQLDPLAIRRLLRKEEGVEDDKVENRAKQWYPKLGLSRKDERIAGETIFGYERDWLRREYGLDLGEAEVEAQLRSGGTQHLSLASELETLFLDLDDLVPPGWDAPNGIASVEDAGSMLKALARWAGGEGTKAEQARRRKVAKELKQILDHPGYRAIWERYGSLRGRIESIIALRK